MEKQQQRRLEQRPLRRCWILAVVANGLMLTLIRSVTRNAAVIGFQPLRSAAVKSRYHTFSRCLQRALSSDNSLPSSSSKPDSPSPSLLLLNQVLTRSNRVLSNRRRWLEDPQGNAGDVDSRHAVEVGEAASDVLNRVQDAISLSNFSSSEAEVTKDGSTLGLDGLLEGVSSRAQRTLQVPHNNEPEPSDSSAIRVGADTRSENSSSTSGYCIDDEPLFVNRTMAGPLLGAAIARARQTLAFASCDEFQSSTTRQASNLALSSPLSADVPSPSLLPPSTFAYTTDDVTKGYGKNPTISMIALAHSLWSHVVRPDVDTAIDATAGNGGDSVALAHLLFSQATLKGDHDRECHAQLVSMDVQATACHNTTQKLTELLPEAIFRQHVQVLHTSHAPLPLPRNTSSVALVVYNLGFLPQADNKQSVTTMTDTTVASMADAALLLRIGGMISVMTYPRTNREEALAVAAFLEGLALFSSDTMSWESYISNLDDASYNAALRERLSVTLRHALDEGGRGQVWRVHEHKKLGWIDAPILLTATRVK